MVKNLPSSAGDADLIPGSGRSPGEGNGNPLQYCCLVNPRDRGAWKAIVHGVAEESDTTEQLNNSNICHLYLIFGFCYVAKSCQTLLWPHGPRCRLRCFWFCSSCGYSIVPVTFIENTIFVSINDIGTLSRSIGRKFWVYFWTPQPDSLICISIFFTYIDQDHMVLIT